MYPFTTKTPSHVNQMWDLDPSANDAGSMNTVVLESHLSMSGSIDVGLEFGSALVIGIECRLKVICFKELISLMSVNV